MTGETTRSQRHSGGCQCGAVRYALYAAPHDVHFCHCRMCQKAVGNVFAALAPVQQTDFAWTRGTPRFYRSSPVAERGYCADCGTPLSFAYLDSDRISVTIGSLDRPAEVPVEVHYGVEARVPWLKLADGLPASTTEDDQPPERLAQIVSHQHPDGEG